MSTRWICSRCAQGVSGVGSRMRFAHEPCPSCDAPGCGMVMVADPALDGATVAASVDRHAITQRIMVPVVTRRVTRTRWPLTDALLGMWAHPYSPRHRRWAFWAALRMRRRGVEVFDGRDL